MNEVIEAITYIEEPNENGIEIKKEVSRKTLYATESSTNYNDFYKAKKIGIDATITFKVRWEDFISTRYTANKKHYFPTKVIYQGAEYKLVRWRAVGKHEAELICG